MKLTDTQLVLLARQPGFIVHAPVESPTGVIIQPAEPGTFSGLQGLIFAGARVTSCIRAAAARLSAPKPPGRRFCPMTLSNMRQLGVWSLAT